MGILADESKPKAPKVPEGFRYFPLKLPIELFDEASRLAIERTASRQAVIFDWILWGRKADPRNTDKT